MSILAPDQRGHASDHARPQTNPPLLSASTIKGDEVRNKRHDKLGSIQDLMLDTHSGQVRYAVMSCGGFLGMGDKLFAIPWRALQLDAVNKCFVLDIEVERIKAAPGFDKEHWPNMADATWAKDVETYYTPLQ